MQGAFSEMDDDIGWNDFALRNYDPQIGRFVQQDPYGQFASPYLGMGNDPVNLIDPSGGVGIPCPGTSALSIFLDNAVYAIGNALNSVSHVANIVGYASAFTATASAGAVAIKMSNITNGQIMTIEVGSSVRASDPDGLGQSGGTAAESTESDDNQIHQIVDVWIYEELWENVYQTHIAGALKNPQLIQPDQTILLNYDPVKSRQRARRYAAQVANGLFPNPNPSVYDVDEFPYASTFEGGAKAACRLVRRRENRSHGQYIGALVRKFKMKEGDKFRVHLISKDRKIPQLKPAPQPNPTFNPKFHPTGPPIIIPPPLIRPTPIPEPVPIPVPRVMPFFWGPLFEKIFAPDLRQRGQLGDKMVV